MTEYRYTWTIMKASITFNFNFCPLVSMPHSQGLNNKINFFHGIVLRITYGDKIFSCQSFLDEDNSVSIQQNNLQLLATEMLKLCNNISPKIPRDIFKPRVMPYRLRKYIYFQRHPRYPVLHVTQTFSYLGPKFGI